MRKTAAPGRGTLPAVGSAAAPASIKPPVFQAAQNHVVMKKPAPPLTLQPQPTGNRHPVYRPGPSPVVDCRRASGIGAVQPQVRPAGPPVYRPKQISAAAQPKTPRAPPGYPS